MCYETNNTITSIGPGEKKALKIPQLIIDEYGHTTAISEDSVEIEIPGRINGTTEMATPTGVASTQYTPEGSVSAPTITVDPLKEKVITIDESAYNSTDQSLTFSLKEVITGVTCTSDTPVFTGTQATISGSVEGLSHSHVINLNTTT